MANETTKGEIMDKELQQKKLAAWQNVLNAAGMAQLTKVQHAKVEQDMVYLGRELGIVLDDSPKAEAVEVVEDKK